MFTVFADPSRKLVRAHLSGFLSAREVQEFSRVEQGAVRGMGLGDGEYLLLVDTSGCVIQPQEVVSAFQQLVENSPLKARRIAIVRHSVLSRMQTERIIRFRENAAVFDSTEEAEAWLLALEQKQAA
jgi:hypothetical protein